MLKVKNLNVSYDGIQVLWDVSLKVKTGEIVALIGSNGAGKTTTVNTIAGLIRPRAGDIIFLGEKIDGRPPHCIIDAGIALIPEGRELFPRMTTSENLLLGAFTRRAREKLNDTLEWIYQLFPILKERKEQLAGTLSGGEQQMLAIARGLMSRPKLLMLDEPSLGLAPLLVMKVFEIVDRLREKNVTILLVEQNVYHTLEIADRGYVLESGRVTLEGEGRKLLGDQHVKKAYLGM